MIPHITNEIKRCIDEATDGVDVGARRDRRHRRRHRVAAVPRSDPPDEHRARAATTALFVHLTLVPFIAAAGELKTKPTQHSVQGAARDRHPARRRCCAAPTSRCPTSERAQDRAVHQRAGRGGDLGCRTSTRSTRSRACCTSRASTRSSATSCDLHTPPADLSALGRAGRRARASRATRSPSRMVGKYVDLPDAYKSLTEALRHAGMRTAHARVKIEVARLRGRRARRRRRRWQASTRILVPGGFGKRGVEGKIADRAATRARTSIPYLGICLGMQVAMIEFARHVAGLADANSTEFDPQTPHPVIAPDHRMAGPRRRRRDAQREVRPRRHHAPGRAGPCAVKPGTLAHEIYGKTSSPSAIATATKSTTTTCTQLEDAGLVISAPSRCDDLLVEIDRAAAGACTRGSSACQFHPEFKSTPRDGHPLFNRLHPRRAASTRPARQAPAAAC